MLGRRILNICGGATLVAAGAFSCLGAVAESIPPKTPAPPTPASPPNPPLVTYPTVTPASAASAHSIYDLRKLKGPAGVPRLATPNPWFPIDVYQGTITRQ